MTPLQQIILDAVTYAGPYDLWPDDPDEERAHGPTVERRAGDDERSVG